MHRPTGGVGFVHSPYSGHASCNVPTSNKVLYTELMIHHHTGTAELTFFPEGPDGSKGPMWHGIHRVRVRPDNRETFDAGFVPSWTSCRVIGGDISRKTAQRVWKDMGFSATRMTNKGLFYECTGAPAPRQPVQGREKPHTTGISARAARGAEPWTFTRAWADKRAAIEVRYR